MSAALTSGALRSEGARLYQALQSFGAQPVEVEVLQPAGTLLDVYGEDIRARAYVTQDPEQGEMMLRPDFTVPVVQAHMELGADPARYCYMGEVFRKQEGRPPVPGRGAEHLQVGYEVFDRENPLRADAEVFSLFARLLAGRRLRAAIGDIGILRAAVQGLPISEPRRAALLRHLWRPRRFRALLERFASGQPDAARLALLGRLRAGENVIPDLPHLGLRTRAEVEARLAALLADADEPALDPELVSALEALAGISARAGQALTELSTLTARLPWIAPSIARFERRLTLLEAHGAEPEALQFEASYGRTTLEYYDGFVFGFYSEARPELPPAATGGRYDALTRVLGAGREIPAVGGVLRPAVLVELLEGGPA